MRISIAITLACSLVTAASCRKDDPDSTNPDAASDEGLLGLDVASSPAKKRKGTTVSVGCVQDPADPDCAEVLGATRSSSGELEFTGNTCRTNLCNGQGDCDIDVDGFVACACDDGAIGPNCDKRKR